MEDTDSLDSETGRVSDKEEPPDSRETEVIVAGRLAEGDEREVEIEMRGMIQGSWEAEEQKVEEAVNGKIHWQKKQAICWVGDGQKDKGQTATAHNTETGVDRNWEAETGRTMRSKNRGCEMTEE